MENIVEIWVLAIQNRNRENERIRHAQLIGVAPAPPEDGVEVTMRDGELKLANDPDKEHFDLWETEPTVDPDR